MWNTEKVLETSLSTIEGLREGPASVHKCSETLHIEDKFHQWVDNKLGSKIEEVQQDVVTAQQQLYCGFVKVTAFLWEEPLDGIIPMQQPPMHMAQRMLVDLSAFVSCACTTFNWMQKEHALEHGRALAGPSIKRDLMVLRPSDTLAAVSLLSPAPMPVA